MRLGLAAGHPRLAGRGEPTANGWTTEGWPNTMARMPATSLKGTLRRISHGALIVLSLTALLDVLLLGYTRPPLADEGAGAHIFQLSIVAMAPFGLLFLATADWTDPARTARRLALPTVLVVLAFAALFYLEHYFYPAHYPVL